MKMLIEIQGNKPLSAYGDNHVIAYDSNKNSYYVTTAESFFAGQNEKIKDLLDKITAFEGKFKDFLSSFYRCSFFKKNSSNT